MAIFAGTFTDDAGDPFDPGVFQINTNASATLLILTGDLIPDGTGTYRQSGTFGGKPRYERADGAYQNRWFIFPGVWSIQVNPFVPGGAWIKFGDPVTGVYAPAPPFFGDPDAAWQLGGSLRLRIHGRRHGSGAMPNHYPPGPNYILGYYDYSPRQWMARFTFGQIMKEYLDIPPFPPVHVTGVLNPDVTGRYGGQDVHNGKSHWADTVTTYDIWWVPLTNSWVIYDAFPIDPLFMNVHWIRSDPSPYGPYQPLGGAGGIAIVSAP